MKIFLVRHTESQANKNKIYSGQKNYKLTQKGIEQTQNVVDFFKNFYEQESTNSDLIIYTSPLERCVFLANRIAEIKKQKINIKKEIIEYNFGIFEGFKAVDLEDNNEYKLWCSDYINYIIPQGESLINCKDRVFKFLDEISKQNKDVIIVAHDGIVKLCILYFLNLKLEDYWRFYTSNGSIVEIEYNYKFGYLKSLINN